MKFQNFLKYPLDCRELYGQVVMLLMKANEFMLKSIYFH